MVWAPTAINANPQMGGPGVTNVTGSCTSGVFTVNINGLAPGTVYSFAMYATNSAGTGYSATSSFDSQTPFSYSASGGVVTISGYNGTPPAMLTIPSTLYGMPVTSIGSIAFEGSTGLTSINIPPASPASGHTRSLAAPVWPA